MIENTFAFLGENISSISANIVLGLIIGKVMVCFILDYMYAKVRSKDARDPAINIQPRLGSLFRFLQKLNETYERLFPAWDYKYDQQNKFRP